MSDLEKNVDVYYKQRASEYELIYKKSERQKDLKEIKYIVSHVFPDIDVLEIACGTGFWTQYAAKCARSICAIDVNDEVLNLAKQKNYGNCKIIFQKMDAYLLDSVNSNFSAGLAAFWWSHIPKKRIEEFITTFHSKLFKDALIVVIDNSYVEGISTPISRKDKDGNTYQIRQLANGSTYEVLKNFVTEDEFINNLSPYSNKIEFKQMKYYWMAKYYVK